MDAATTQEGASGPPSLASLKEGQPGSLAGRPLRLYADGIFDLFHHGHAKALEQAKKSYPNTYLMVGVCGDEITHRYKGTTVMTEDERYESVRHCKWVDEVIEDAPWVVTESFLEKYQIDYVCHDALPYADVSGASDGDCYAHLRKMGKFLETQRTGGISTSDIITRILSRYDDFVERQLKRGYTPEDLKVQRDKSKGLEPPPSETKADLADFSTANAY